ncbi:MAG: hypothetical protein KJZ69_09570 [Phycisphaerales bacterium]|nr:hypothetical protein [Phycisphaerales bacterium]
MNIAPRSLSARLARLEAAIRPRGPRCEVCGYPEREAILVMVTADDSPLPTCEICGRTLDFESGRPMAGPFKRIILGDSERV